MTTTRYAEDFQALQILTVNHNLGKWPIVQVLDSGTGLVQAPDSIHQTNTNTCVVTMPAPGNYRVICVI